MQTWREFSVGLYADCNFAAPASAAQIENVQQTLSVVLPRELQSLLEESNGIVDEWQEGPVLSTEDIIQLNVSVREELGKIYPAFFARLFIAKGAGGDLWAYKVNADARITDSKIYLWEHELAEEEAEEATYSVQSPTLREFVRWHLTELSVL